VFIAEVLQVWFETGQTLSGENACFGKGDQKVQLEAGARPHEGKFGEELSQGQCFGLVATIKGGKSVECHDHAL
ncbi:MAG TPA: hypothetical protein VKP08_06330, partial [Anaerolineales bacterium]|nr:hypothetical protein [Anaerolineales bacterium]